MPLSADTPERRLLLAQTSVLFVDHREDSRRAAQEILAGAVGALHLSAAGQEGLFSHALNRPDVAVLAADTPGMGGLAVAEAIHATDPDAPVLLICDLSDTATLRRAVELGITEFLERPPAAPLLLSATARAAKHLRQRRELARQARLSQLMLDAAPSPSVLAQLETGRVLAGNQLAAELGYRAGGQCGGQLIPQHLLEELRQGGLGLLAAANSCEVEAHGRHWMLHWAPADEGAVLFTALDITRRVEVERFRDDVERIARHDLKTPLSAFTAVPDLLLEADNLTEEQREFILLIRDAGTRMLGMINLSLDLFKMETGAYARPNATFCLFELAGHAVRGVNGLAQSLGLEIALGDESAGGRAMVCGDALLCHCMLDNLLKNALEAAPAHSAVEVALLPGPPPRVVIRNRGEVPADMLARFFDKYATSGKRHGTGLGTYSARMVARAHGGDITLDASTPGETVVTVELPPCR